MRIGLIASNWRPIPGGKDNVYAPGVIIQMLADGLIDRGHQVTLFAPEGTRTKAKLISLGLKSAYEDYQQEWRQDLATFLQIEQAYEMILLSEAFEMAKDGDFDLVHVHKTNIEPFFANFINCPMLITSHHSYLKAKAPIFSMADKMRLAKYKNVCYYTALSEFIKKEIDLNFVDIVPNGLEMEKYPFNETGGKDLVFVGRMISSKGPDLALKIAEKAQKRILMIGDIRVGKTNQEFWQKLTSKITESSFAEYIGFVTNDKIASYYQKAKMIVIPNLEPEAFGLVAVEAMACGTPVVAFDIGPIREIVQDGQTGYIVPANNLDAMVKSIQKIYNMSEGEYLNLRQRCRRHVEKRFTKDIMIDGYIDAYQKVIEDHKRSHHATKN